MGRNCKICKRCERFLPIDDFYMASPRSESQVNNPYYSSKCKVCISEERRDKHNRKGEYKPLIKKEKQPKIFNGEAEARKFIKGLIDRDFTFHSKIHTIRAISDVIEYWYIITKRTNCYDLKPMNIAVKLMIKDLVAWYETGVRRIPKTTYKYIRKEL